MSHIIQWYNENSGRAYPLREDVTAIDDTGIQLPTDVILDMGLRVPATYPAPILHSIDITGNLVGVTICDASGSGLFALAGGGILRSELEPYKAYPLQGMVDNVTGWIVFGDNLSVGSYRFSTPEQAAIEQRAVRVTDIPPITRFKKLGGNTSVYVDKLVSVLGRAGLVIERDDNKLILSLEPSIAADFLGPCNNLLIGDLCNLSAIRKLNGVGPDDTGRITLKFE